MTEEPNSIRYVSNKAWWAPLLLLLLGLSTLRHAHRWWEWLACGVAIVILALLLYVTSHPTLTWSASAITQRRGPFRVSVNLNQLESVRVNTTARRTTANDPQTGERRQIGFNVKNPDDWAGTPPVLGVYLSDQQGHRLTLRFEGTSADSWCAHVARAITNQPLLEVGPRVSDTLARVTR